MKNLGHFMALLGANYSAHSYLLGVLEREECETGKMSTAKRLKMVDPGATDHNL